MKFIKILAFSFTVLFFTLNLSAQIGVSGTYTTVNTDFEFDKEFPGFSPATTFGIDYWFRLKNQRVEFYPQISWLRSGTESYLNNFDQSENIDLRMDVYSLKLNTRIYPFDFKGDCNCPTWKKDGTTFNKGFYFMATFGYGVLNQSRTGDGGGFAPTSLGSFGGGFGLDVGLSKYLTLSPFLTYERTTSAGWVLHPCDTCDQILDNTILNPLSVGLHLQYRWKDY